MCISMSIHKLFKFNKSLQVLFEIRYISNNNEDFW